MGSLPEPLGGSEMHTMFRTAFAGLGLSAAMVLGPAALAETVAFKAELKASNEVPAVESKGSGASPIKGSATLTDAQAADLTAGRWYFNIHTAANKGGEIRGQVVKGQ